MTPYIFIARMMSAIGVLFIIASIESLPRAQGTFSTSFWNQVKVYLGLPSLPTPAVFGPRPDLSKVLSEELRATPEVGVVWVADLDTNLHSQNCRQLTFDGGYRSPIFDPSGTSILAMKDSNIIRLSLSGQTSSRSISSQLAVIPGLVKLVGFERDNHDNILILYKKSGRLFVGFVSLRYGTVTEFKYYESSPIDIGTLKEIAGWRRTYGDVAVSVYGDGTVGVPEELGELEEGVIIIERAGEVISAIDCGARKGAQPSLSKDKRALTFIGAGR